MKLRHILLSVCLGLSSPAFSLILLSDDFIEGGTIPTGLTCHGGNHIPALNWQNIPTDTQSFVMIMEDPDAPMGTWTHWVLYNIPGTANALSDTTSVGTTGINSWLHARYDGPCPPSGTHRYVFTLYALDILLPLPTEQVSKDQVLAAMRMHTLDRAQLTGVYASQ